VPPLPVGQAEIVRGGAEVQAQETTRRAQSIELVNDLALVGMFLQRVGNRQVRAYRLNQSQFTVLGEIVRNRDLQQKEITGELLLEKSNLSKIIDKLVGMSLVTRQTPEHDGRAVVLNATEAGRKLYRECSQSLDQLKTLFTATLDDAELTEVAGALRRLKELAVSHLTYEGETRGDVS